MLHENLSKKNSLKKSNKHLIGFEILGYSRDFEATVIRQVQQGFDGRTTNSEHDWNFFGAVLYAVTLVSTIGKTKLALKIINVSGAIELLIFQH